MDPDGINYLDMADAYLRHDWHTALNGLWSPLYPLLLGAATLLFKPTASSEFPVVHFVNILGFAGMLACFDYFLETWTQYHERAAALGSALNTRLPTRALIIIAYMLVAFTSLEWITMEDIGPDYLVAASVFLAAALLLRTQSEKPVPLTWALLGVTLGLGYLAKAPMLPIAILLFAIAFLYIRGQRKMLALSVICFALVSAPFIVALSMAKARVTVGDSGTLNYAWHVNRIPLAHWHGGGESGSAKHPTRQLQRDPAVYEFGEPIRATYPVSYDPSYWEEGLRPKFHLLQQLAAINANVLALCKMLWQISALVVALFILVFMGRGLNKWPVSGAAAVLLPLNVAAVAMFTFIHIEPRYIAPFVVIATLVLFSSVRLPDAEYSRALLRVTTLALLVVFCLFEGVQTYTEIRRGLREHNEQLLVAQELWQMGLRPGDRVANIGSSYTAYWARLARLSICSEIPEPEVAKFWQSNSTGQTAALATMIRTGASVVVTDRLPAYNPVWHRIKETDYYFYKPEPAQ